MFGTYLTRCWWEHFDGKDYRLSFLVYIVGAAASGKSFLTEMDRLIMAPMMAADRVGREWERQYKEEMQQRGGGSDATGTDITYRITQNKDARRLTVDFSLSERQQVDFILSDTRGMVHRSLSHTGEAGVSQTVDINYGGLRRGQYVLYICVNGKQYAEKFNVK